MALKDPEKRKAYKKAYDEKRKRYNQDWYIQNREMSIAQSCQYQKDHPEQRRRNARQRYNRNRRFIVEYKLGNPCAVCGQSDPRCLDFHHLDPKKKTKPISVLAISGSLENLQNEINKCEMLCANCHRKETMSLETTQLAHYTK